MKNIENNLNLIKGPGMTIEELFEKFGTEVGEEELLKVKHFRDIIDLYEYVTSEKRRRMKENNSNMLIMTAEEIIGKYGDELSEEELFHIRQISTILDHYKSPESAEEQYWTEKEEQILDREPLRWNSDQLRRALAEVAKAYSTMSEEDLSDMTPFDVLNDINKLI